MLIKKRVYLKHSFQNASDQYIKFEVDTDASSIQIEVEEIDTWLLTCFLKDVLMQSINESFENNDVLVEVSALAYYRIKLVVRRNHIFSVRFVDGSFGPQTPTVILTPWGE